MEVERGHLPQRLRDEDDRLGPADHLDEVLVRLVARRPPDGCETGGENRVSTALPKGAAGICVAGWVG